MEEIVKTSSGADAMMGGLLGSMVKGNNCGNAMEMMAAMNGGMGNQWLNNPFLYLIFLAMFGNGGFGFGNNRGNLVQDAEIQSQIQSLRSQMAENHNSDLLMSAIKGNNEDLATLGANLSCDFNQLQNAVCSVRSAIEQVAGQVGFSSERVINSVNTGNLNLIQQLKDCCCQTQQNIIKMGYEQQLGQKDLQNAMQQGFSYTNTGLERGFSNLGFQLSQGLCDLKTSGQMNTQRIVDTLSNHWNEDLQLRLNRAELELSQQRQNAALIAALGTKSTGTTTGA